jgi:ribosomal-protein-serine acetyltransferase
MDSLLLAPHALLRPLAPDDAPALHHLLTANRAHLDEWLRWSHSVQTLADAQGLIALFQEKLARGDGFHLGLWVEGTLAGGCVCWYIHRQNRNAEVGYWLGQAHLRRGWATRSVQAVLSHLFAGGGLHRVEMQCAVPNRASRTIPERLGFQLEGIRRESHWITSRFLDHAVYGLLEAEWRQLTTA